MKKTLLIMIMALALLLTQCRKPAVEFPTAEGVTVSMTVTAGPGSKTDISTAGGITWSSGDKLYVGFNGKYVGCLEIKSGQNTPTGWFSGNVTLPNTPTGEQTFHFFYLGSNNSVAPNVGDEAVSVSFAEQEIYADANNKLVNASKHHVGYGSAKGTVAGSEVTGINVTLVSKVALARFSFKKSGTPANPYEGALTLSGDHIYNSMTVGFGGTFSGAKTGGGEISLTNTTTSEKYVMLVPPATAVEETLKFDAGAGTTDCNLANGIEANKYYGQGGAIEVTVKMPVPVTGVTLDKSTLSLEVGADYTLTATVAPDDATNKSVTWNSSDESVATVADGTVTAVAVGTATITVTTVDSGKTATCTVTVSAVPVESVNLDETELSLAIGATATLTATVLPDNATNKNVTWSSSDGTKATVDQNGVVTAVAAGPATITVTTEDGGKIATCAVTVTKAHEYVDLGLSVRWAKCNLGAEHEYDYGKYYAWGETAGYNEAMVGDGANSGASYSPGTVKTNYVWAYYKWGSDTYKLGKYVYSDKPEFWGGSGNPDGKTVLDDEDDAAHVNWGGDWRMPTKDEFNELRTNTDRTWYAAGNTEFGGVAGCKFANKSDPTKYVFLPAAGAHSYATLYGEGTVLYWSSTLYEVHCNKAYGFEVAKSYATTNWPERWIGRSVRPVCEP